MHKRRFMKNSPKSNVASESDSGGDPCVSKALFTSILDQFVFSLCPRIHLHPAETLCGHSIKYSGQINMGESKVPILKCD